MYPPRFPAYLLLLALLPSPSWGMINYTDWDAAKYQSAPTDTALLGSGWDTQGEWQYVWPYAQQHERIPVHLREASC